MLWVVSGPASGKTFKLNKLNARSKSLVSHSLNLMISSASYRKISPKKTYAGLIGSFILSIVGALVYIKYINLGGAAYLEIQYLLSIKGLENFKLYFLIIILFISLISQIGDLIISYFKRLAKVKDTGNLLPGHGGLLDRVDGIIFAIPVSYLLFNFLS